MMIFIDHCDTMCVSSTAPLHFLIGNTVGPMLSNDIRYCHSSETTLVMEDGGSHDLGWCYKTISALDNAYQEK